MTTGEDTRALGRGLIDTFGKGWARPDIDLLMSVYAPEPVFVETPFSDALKGAAAIRRCGVNRSGGDIDAGHKGREGHQGSDVPTHQS